MYLLRDFRVHPEQTKEFLVCICFFLQTFVFAATIAKTNARRQKQEQTRNTLEQGLQSILHIKYMRRKDKYLTVAIGSRENLSSKENLSHSPIAAAASSLHSVPFCKIWSEKYKSFLYLTKSIKFNSIPSNYQTYIVKSYVSLLE